MNKMGIKVALSGAAGVDSQGLPNARGNGR